MIACSAADRFRPNFIGRGADQVFSARGQCQWAWALHFSSRFSRMNPIHGGGTMQRARHRILPATLILAALVASARAAASVIFSPVSGLANTTGDQEIQLFVSGSDLTAGENLNIQINTGTSG